LIPVSMPPIRYQNLNVNIGPSFGPPVASVGSTVIPISPIRLLPSYNSNTHIYATLDNLLVDVQAMVENKYTYDAWTPDMKSFVNAIISQMHSGNFSTFGSMGSLAQKAYADQNGPLISNLMFKMVEQQFASRWSFLQEKEEVMLRDPYADPGATEKFLTVAGIGIVVVAVIVVAVMILAKGKKKGKKVIKKKASMKP